ncbi:MaoC/PaaZ C-terminal domain-containing protein [Halovenus salina]|uniref:MaoC/PaaZ C-terminal domain-containing protein n=1 Tax=Halovenus salina TaxID=1510225 RepID=A0ABD5VXQ8_9EURY|nr:MaoC/PaaZ C-terminal domain-containing protein [Halovenus salina]
MSTSEENAYPPQVGDTHTYKRTFTVEEVQQFTELSGDAQPIHTDPDEDGRLMAQGLLTATLPTKIGGDLEVLAGRMDIRFVEPVYTGDRITCTWTNERVEEHEDRYSITADVVCTREETEVLRATIEGLVWKEQ